MIAVVIGLMACCARLKARADALDQRVTGIGRSLEESNARMAGLETTWATELRRAWEDSLGRRSDAGGARVGEERATAPSAFEPRSTSTPAHRQPPPPPSSSSSRTTPSLKARFDKKVDSIVLGTGGADSGLGGSMA